MKSKSLGILAIAIIGVMGIVATAGLDNLPNNLRASAITASAQVSNDRTHFEEQRKRIEQALRDDPALFRTQSAAWKSRIEQAQTEVSKAEAEASALKKLAEGNRREDAKKVEEGLARLQSVRSGSVQQLQSTGDEVERWLGYKRELPKQLEAMKADYDALHAFDVEPAAAPVRKAMTDWPAKRSDLEARLAALTALKTSAEQTWNTSADLRAQVQKGDAGSIDYPALFQLGDRLDQAERQAREGTETVKQLADQLYVNWDKLLVDVEHDRQKIRLVRTRFADAALKDGQTSQEEKWERIEPAQSRRLERNVGMVIGHKPAGKYDSEADSGAQAPGYAYVAPHGQSNSYGGWHNGVWTWLPQYLILSHMLRGPSMPPIMSGDYGSYQRARDRGEIFYGHSTRGSGGSVRRTMDRVSGGSPRQEEHTSGGGFSGSRYQSRGTYAGSRYQNSGGGFRSFSRGARSFGRRR
ncbi:MAG: hypothetical protein HY820_23875 [Acidobacteria bacterium]|nr:hypothetical protein [Acidobacteriota bacterium]